MYLLTLSATLNNVADPDVLTDAAEGVWREVYPPSGVPVPIRDRAVVTLSRTDLQALLDALEVGCDGIEGDDTEAHVRHALVRFIEVLRGSEVERA